MNYQRFSKTRALEVLKECGVPEHLQQEALQSVTDGYKQANKIVPLLCNLTAPLVVPFALLFSKWEDEELSSPFSKWNNDTNLNGDRGPFPVPYEKDSVDAISRCFYNVGHHPREYGSRYKWIGLRNRGKRAYLREVPLETFSNKEEIWGTQGLTRGSATVTPKTGWMVTRVGDYWQIIGCHEFGYDYYQEPRWGWKSGLSLALHQQFGKSTMMAVGINFKLRKQQKG